MIARSVLTLVVSLSMLFTSPRQVLAYGHINGFLGLKFMDGSDWGSLQLQGAGGLQFDYAGANWPVAIAIDLMGSYSERDETFFVPDTGEVTDTWEVVTNELDIGVRKHWRESTKVQPYLGGGIALVGAQMEAQTSEFGFVRDSNIALGVWGNAGVLWSVLPHFNIGIDARLSAAEVRLFDQNYQAGGLYLGLILGYLWNP